MNEPWYAWLTVGLVFGALITNEAWILFLKRKRRDAEE